MKRHRPIPTPLHLYGVWQIKKRRAHPEEFAFKAGKCQEMFFWYNKAHKRALRKNRLMNLARIRLGLEPISYWP